MAGCHSSLAPASPSDEHARLRVALLYAVGPVCLKAQVAWRGCGGASAHASCETESSHPPHPGAAEGFSFLSAVAGLAVLGFQLAEYGYLPEAVPIAGGVCSNL